MVSDGSDGRPPSSSLVAAGYERIVIGDQEWSREPGQDWQAGGAPPPYPPAQWGEQFQDPVGLHLGRTEEVAGEEAQIVTFYVPGTQLAPAYYAWWVGTQSGRVLQETMVSRFHYMVWNYADFDQPLPIAPPTTGGTPTAAAG